MASSDLANFLQDKLSELSEQWWEKLVVDRLSFQQQRIVIEKNTRNLRELDFAALLRILDQNWYDLSDKLTLPREARNWVKELQTVRNKWAHMATEEVPASEVYRDADTLGRLLVLINADKMSIEAVQATKDAALAKMTDRGSSASQSKTATEKPNRTSTEPAQLFKVGDVVVLRSDKNIKLPVLDVIAGGPEVRYCVFQEGAKATYYESQLQAVGADSDERPSISIDEFRARLTALHLLSPSTANLFSLRSGRVNFVPYQYRPVLKLIRSDRPRLLIADEVGVGKTIEAGLILKELRSRMDISSVLIICPKALVAERKWQSEMKRFDESFNHLDGKLLRHCLHETDLEGDWPEQYQKAILPFSLFDSDLIFGPNGKKKHKDRGLLALDPAPSFDLVIVDEAHHIRNSETYLHQGVRYFCDNARAVLLMTATPVQLGSNDLFTLLNVLRPDLVIDHNSFEQMAEPNRFINEAVRLCREKGPDWQEEATSQLQEATQTEWGRLFLREGPTFQAAFDKLQEAQLPDVERVALTRTLEELYTFSSIINRTRRRDIGEFTSRKPHTLTVEFTDKQRELHDDLLSVIARILSHCHGQQNVKFMMTTIRRQAASCLYGLAPLLSDILNRKLDQLELIESADSDDDVDLSFVEDIRAEIEYLIASAENLDQADPKIEAFIRALKDKTKLDNNKALVFSTFRHTLAYLAHHTEAANLRYGLIHGDVPDDERASLRKRFSLSKDDPDALDVLLSSEVGCEGLDFQFCDFLVNYDLPWNPMRIEQRIGRIDRYGQKSETVSIVNLVTPGTVDADIYQRCLMRIGVFQHAVGGSEEILGQITQEIHDIAESFVLTEEERSSRLKQLADNGIRRIREEQELEEKESEFFGLNVPKVSWREEIEDAESEWLSPAAIQGCISVYLKTLTDSESDHIVGEKTLKTLRLGQNARNALLSDFKQIKKSTDPLSKNWEKWLKGGNSSLPVTFDQETASDNPKAVHLTVLHPLVRQAARFLETNDAMHCTLRVTDEVLPSGTHRFALYRWMKFGIKPDEELLAIADNPTVEVALMKVLNQAVEPIEPLPTLSRDFDDLDSLHYAKWRAAQADHIAQNRELAEHRVQSLTVSHRARARTLEDQLSKSTNEKIRIMKQSELARANADFDRRVAELRDAGNTGDIRTAPILFGTVMVGEE
ncbi:DEAD/DEAH box helicase [Thalassospira alkalitolerans]|uniref:DEAD/DEAH box helicase n=1 Tax=Thalassospira alkalitolerans TaxID=1293890 RepID=UPI0030ECFB37|tara:strand:- start:3340 stop:6873 length:3534 start_codon:yes stop_codon:yes gene_type:complete